MRKRIKEKSNLLKDLKVCGSSIKEKLSGLDWYILSKALQKNVDREKNSWEKTNKLNEEQ